MTTQPLSLTQFDVHGADALTFLQGQLSSDLKHVDSAAQITAICNLKGRVDFVLWVSRRSADEFVLATHPSLGTRLAQHIKKYAAFSDVTLSESGSTYLSINHQGGSNQTSSHPLTQDRLPLFQLSPEPESALSLLDLIMLGISVITDQTAGLFQPQELRLHELGGVSYSKGCYLGQEVVARLWFKSAPKAWLHLLSGIQDAQAGAQLAEQIEVVSQSGDYALVVGRREAIDRYCDQSLLEPNLADETKCSLQQLPDYFNSSPARTVVAH